MNGLTVALSTAVAMQYQLCYNVKDMKNSVGDGLARITTMLCPISPNFKSIREATEAKIPGLLSIRNMLLGT
jgi:hypothetical protein